MKGPIKEVEERKLSLNRRAFLSKSCIGLGTAALGGLLGCETNSVPNKDSVASNAMLKGVIDNLHLAPKAKRIIYLFQSGGPSQFELFDHKPLLNKLRGQDLPDEIRNGQRLTGMSSGQESFPLVGSPYSFKQHGNSGIEMSELLPHTSKIVDDICVIKSMHTEAINHDPAITFFQTGHQLPGRPSIGSWLSYGLGSLNNNLPTFVVLQSKNAGGQPLYARLWGNGFLPTEHQGVQFRSGKDPVLYLNNPENYQGEDRRKMLDYLKQLNEVQYSTYGDPEIRGRIAQYEMAYRMQTSVPESLDLTDEPDHIFEMYGEGSRDPGTYAANCLLARKLLEKDVRFVQLYHKGWDQHTFLPGGIKNQCKNTDQATAALVKDLKQRGLLEDTLVIWGGEFGRTVYSQGKLTDTNYGRDHHPRCFTMWMAGGQIRFFLWRNG